MVARSRTRIVLKTFMFVFADLHVNIINFRSALTDSLNSEK